MHYLSISFSLSLTPFCITTRTYTRTHCNLSVVEDRSIWIKAQPGFVLKAKSFVLGIPYSCTSPQLKLRLSKLKFPVPDPQPHPVTILRHDWLRAHSIPHLCACAQPSSHSPHLSIERATAFIRNCASPHMHPLTRARTRSHTHTQTETRKLTHPPLPCWNRVPRFTTPLCALLVLLLQCIVIIPDLILLLITVYYF